MKRKYKILLIIFIVFVLLLVLFFYFNQKNYNKVQELVCIKSYFETDDKEKITIKFNEKGEPYEYVETQIIAFSSYEEAKREYDNTIGSTIDSSSEQNALFFDSKMELIDNTIESSFYFEINKDDKIFNKTKEELMDLYEKEYMYECD